MSIKVSPIVDVTVGIKDLNVSGSTPVYSTDSNRCIEIESFEPVETIKKEYSIVGDSFYAGTSSDVAPSWLTDLINSVVDSSVSSGLRDYDLLVQDVRNAIDAIDIAQNTYVEQINFTSLVDGIIGTHLDTLNATYDGKFATITNLDIVRSDAYSALAISASDLRVEFTDEITSRITDVQTVFADAAGANADSIESLTTMFIDQDSALSGTADAVSGLQTYVGLTTDGNPDGTGMLSRISIVEKQADGVIEFTVDTYDVMLGIEDPNNNTDNEKS